MSWRNQLLSIFELVGINSGCKYLLRHHPRILMFHKIYPVGTEDNHFGFINNEMFDELISYVQKNYRVYKLEDLVSYRTQHGVFPEDSVVLTFDDGYKSFQELALPILEKYKVPATIFICPKLIDDEETIWPDRLIDAFEAGQTSLKTHQELNENIEYLKKLDVSNRSIELEKLIREQVTASSVNNYSELMNWEDLEKVSSSGLVEIGSHSLTHTILANETEEEANQEIVGSKQLIEKRLKLEVHSFCYPNGRAGNYRQSEVDSLKAAGYRCAVTSEFGFSSKKSSVYELPRFGGDFQTIIKARKYIDGLEFIQRRLLNSK